MNSQRTRTLAILAAATLASLWLACPDGDGEPGDGNDGGTADSGGAVPDETFTARLTGAQEIPPTTVSVSGGGTFHYFHDGGVLAYRIDHDAGSAVVAGHIHRGHGGVNGPVIHPFAGVTSPISGTWVLDGGTGGADYADLAAGRLYVNLHQQGGAGVIRGQILRPGERLYTAALVDLGAGGTAAGGAAFVLSADAGSLSWHVTTNIPTTDPVLGSHIHKRSDNSVLLATPGIGNDGGAGNAPADPGLVTELEGDATYFNVHTQSMPTGRVQGDVLKQ